MLAYTYIKEGVFGFCEKPKPVLLHPRDAIVRVTLSSICSSDLHIRSGAVPRAVRGVTVGHEMVGVVEESGPAVKGLRPGDRVSVNVETFCGECFFCRRGYVNNCASSEGGWALGCRIDGGQAQYVRVPFADTGLTRIPEGVSDEQALFAGDILSTGYWAAKIAGIEEGDTVLVLGGGPTGICCMLCAMLRRPETVIVCEQNAVRRDFLRRHYPGAVVVAPEEAAAAAARFGRHGGADAVIEAAGSDASFRLAWECARPNAVCVIVAMYEHAQALPLPEMYGKNLTFKTGGVDGCDCAEILSLIGEKRLDATPLITHRFAFRDLAAAYDLFASGKDGVMKVAIEM